MNILYFTQFYLPESIAGAFRAHDHAHRWSDLGHGVTVFTAWPSYPIGRIYDGYDVEMFAKQDDDGVALVRSKLIAKPNASLFGRLANALSFLFFGSWNVITKKKKISSRPDVVLATSGSVFAAYVGWLYSRLYRVPLVAEFRDLTFEQMVATGNSPNSKTVKAMRLLELRLAKASKQVVVLTNGFKDVLSANGIDETKISVIPNGADIVPTKKDTRDSEGITFGYFGTMGICQNVADTVELFNELRCRMGMPFSYFLIGEGAKRKEVEELVDSRQYQFAELMHGMSKDELEPYYAKCDFTVVSLQHAPELGASIPSKIFQSFARGVPVLFIGPPGEAAELVAQSEAGICLVGDFRENLDRLEFFFSQQDYHAQIEQMGENAIRLMERQYSRKALADLVLEVLEKSAG